MRQVGRHSLRQYANCSRAECGLLAMSVRYVPCWNIKVYQQLLQPPLALVRSLGRAVAGAAYRFLRRFPDGWRERGAFSRAPERSGRTPDTPGALPACASIDRC